MRNCILILMWGLVLIMFSCRNKNRDQEKICLPGAVSILPFGDGNKPPTPLFIRTDELDTTFYKYDTENTLENMERLGYIIGKDYFRKYTMNPETFYLLKEYIFEYNTHINRTMLNGDDNTVKIVYEDHCDSIAYTVNKSNTGYFTNMIEYLKLSEGPLKKSIADFQFFQE